MKPKVGDRSGTCATVSNCDLITTIDEFGGCVGMVAFVAKGNGLETPKRYLV